MPPWGGVNPSAFESMTGYNATLRNNLISAGINPSPASGTLRLPSTVGGRRGESENVPQVPWNLCVSFRELFAKLD